MISKLLRTPSIYTDNQDTLLFWQRKIFKALFICLLLIGSIPYALSCKYAIETQEWHRVVFYSGIYVWGILVTFADAIPFRLRA